ncbi:MAG: hypothetical protein C0594_02755, partial [Marinilabiliales bacterium]
QAHPVDLSLAGNSNTNFTYKSEGLHSSVGIGLHIAMNENFIIAADYGKALNPLDGNTGLYIGIGYLY